MIRTTVLSTVAQVYEETESLAQTRVYLSEQLAKTIVEPAKLHTRDMVIQQKRVCSQVSVTGIRSNRTRHSRSGRLM